MIGLPRVRLTVEVKQVIGLYVSLCHLAKPAAKQSAAQSADVVDEQKAFKMIVLVLDDTGQDLVDIDLLRLEITIQILKSNAIGPHHELPDVGNGKTAFLEFALLVALPQNFGIYDDHRLIGKRLKVLLIRVVEHWRDVDHKKPLGSADLRRSQADALGGSHRFEHVVDQPLQTFGVLLDAYGLLTKNGVAVHTNRENHILSSKSTEGKDSRR